MVMSVIFFLFACAITHSVSGEQKTEKNMPRESSPFGVLEFFHWNHAWNNYKYRTVEEYDTVIALLKEAGVGFVRVDFLWSDIEPKRGTFNFSKYDLFVDRLSKNKIGILGILNYGTEWASPGGKWNHPPENNELFVAYASAVIERYKGKVKYWEVWNEPDSAVYWQPQDGLKTYGKLLKDVYVAAKNIDPECLILNGGLANGLAGVNILYDNGINHYFDILNIHYFDDPRRPGAIKAAAAYPKLAHKIMSRNGDTHKKIWITEIGCPGVPAGAATGKWWIGENPTEEDQAAWAKDVYAAVLKDGHVEKIFWAFFRDCDKHWNDGVDYFGLVRWDFSKKPAFFAYQECVRAYHESR